MGANGSNDDGSVDVSGGGLVEANVVLLVVGAAPVPWLVAGAVDIARLVVAAKEVVRVDVESEGPRVVSEAKLMAVVVPAVADVPTVVVLTLGSEAAAVEAAAAKHEGNTARADSSRIPFEKLLTEENTER